MASPNSNPHSTSTSDNRTLSLSTHRRVGDSGAAGPTEPSHHNAVDDSSTSSGDGGGGVSEDVGTPTFGSDPGSFAETHFSPLSDPAMPPSPRSSSTSRAVGDVYSPSKRSSAGTSNVSTKSCDVENAMQSLAANGGSFSNSEPGMGFGGQSNSASTSYRPESNHREHLSSGFSASQAKPHAASTSAVVPVASPSAKLVAPTRVSSPSTHYPSSRPAHATPSAPTTPNSATAPATPAPTRQEIQTPQYPRNESVINPYVRYAVGTRTSFDLTPNGISLAVNNASAMSRSKSTDRSHSQSHSRSLMSGSHTSSAPPPPPPNKQILLQQRRQLFGGMHPFSAAEMTHLNSFRTFLTTNAPPYINATFYNDVPLLLRFLQANSWDQAATYEALKGNIEWKRDTSIREKWEPYLALGLVYVFGKDYFQRPILVVRVSRFLSLPSMTGVAVLARWLELSKALYLVPNVVEDLHLLVDFDEVNLPSSSKISKIVNDVNPLVAAILKNYPCCIGAISLVNYNPTVQGVAETLQEMHNLNKLTTLHLCANSSALFHQISPHQLEKRYGGNNPNVVSYPQTHWPNNPEGYEPIEPVIKILPSADVSSQQPSRTLATTAPDVKPAMVHSPGHPLYHTGHNNSNNSNNINNNLSNPLLQSGGGRGGDRSQTPPPNDRKKVWVQPSASSESSFSKDPVCPAPTARQTAPVRGSSGNLGRAVSCVSSDESAEPTIVDRKLSAPGSPGELLLSTPLKQKQHRRSSRRSGLPKGGALSTEHTKKGTTHPQQQQQFPFSHQDSTLSSTAPQQVYKSWMTSHGSLETMSLSPGMPGSFVHSESVLGSGCESSGDAGDADDAGQLQSVATSLSRAKGDEERGIRAHVGSTKRGTFRRLIFAAVELRSFEFDALSSLDALLDAGGIVCVGTAIEPESVRLRFLQANRWDPPSTMTALLNYLEFRREMLPILQSSISTELLAGMVYIFGRDRKDRPLIVCRAARCREVMLHQLFRVLLYWMECAVETLLEPGRVEQWTVIVDFKDVAFYDLPLLKAKEFIARLLDYYPERLNKIFFVNTSAIFRGVVWSGLSLQLPEVTRKKVVICSCSELLPHISASQLEKSLLGVRGNATHQSGGFYRPTMPAPSKRRAGTGRSESSLSIYTPAVVDAIK